MVLTWPPVPVVTQSPTTSSSPPFSETQEGKEALPQAKGEAWETCLK